MEVIFKFHSNISASPNSLRYNKQIRKIESEKDSKTRYHSVRYLSLCPKFWVPHTYNCRYVFFNIPKLYAPHELLFWPFKPHYRPLHLEKYRVDRKQEDRNGQFSRDKLDQKYFSLNLKPVTVCSGPYMSYMVYYTPWAFKRAY